MLLADFCNCHDERALSSGLSIPRRDDGHDRLPFLTHHADLSEKSGDTRRAALRPSDSTPVPVSSHLRGFARPRYRRVRFARLARSRLAFTSRERVGRWRLTLYGSLDRVKDVSSSASALFGRACEECVRLAHADDVPLLFAPEGTSCRRCDRLHGNEPRCKRDGPTKTRVRPSTREGCRQPVDQGAFHRCDGGSVKGLLLFAFRVGLSLTPPTRYPLAGDKVLLRALQACLAICETSSRGQYAFFTSLYRLRDIACAKRAWD